MAEGKKVVKEAPKAEVAPMPAPEPAAAPAEMPTVAEKDAKEGIHEAVRDIVKDKTGKSVGIAGGKEIFDTIVTKIFESVVAEGNFRFPGGFGSLKVVHVAAGKKTLPSGQVINAPARKKIRYDNGTTVREKLNG
jgi:nucleoid DNA-binding protein